MVEPLVYGLQVEIVIVGMFLYALAIFVKAIKHISDEFKFAIVLVMLSLIMEITQGVMMMVLLMESIPANSLLWLISPFVGLIGALFLVMGSRKFLSGAETEG